MRFLLFFIQLAQISAFPTEKRGFRGALTNFVDGESFSMSHK